MRILETCTILAEKEFEKLEDQADFNKRVDPLKYIGRLIASFFTMLLALSFLWIVVIKFLDDKFGSSTDSGNPIDILGDYLYEN